ncbi:MAG: hypothetical protein CME68_03910 [Halobacteriovoraceae bacterium]|nr:hypothetical protein [Halobacteriovoraceae bacterium]
MVPKIFHSVHRAHFSELDLYGHMNSEHYFKYFLNHRFHGMRENDLGLQKVMELPIAFVIRKTEIEYIKPIYGDEPFIITSFISELKSLTSIALCSMKNEEGKLLSTCKMHLVCLDKKTQKPTKWPKGLFEKYFLEKAPIPKKAPTPH